MHNDLALIKAEPVAAEYTHPAPAVVGVGSPASLLPGPTSLSLQQRLAIEERKAAALARKAAKAMDVARSLQAEASRAVGPVRHMRCVFFPFRLPSRTRSIVWTPTRTSCPTGFKQVFLCLVVFSAAKEAL